MTLKSKRQITEYQFDISGIAKESRPVTIVFENGHFAKCVFPFSGTYNRDQWKALVAIESEIRRIEDADIIRPKVAGQLSEWETYCDTNYFDLHRVRRKTERRFSDGYHLQHGEEARDLTELLNRLELERYMAENERIDLAKQLQSEIERHAQCQNERDEAREEMKDMACQLVQAEARAGRFCQERDEIATENMLQVNKLCNQRDEARKDASLLSERLTALELQSTEELARLEGEIDKLK